MPIPTQSGQRRPKLARLTMTLPTPARLTLPIPTQLRQRMPMLAMLTLPIPTQSSQRLPMGNLSLACIKFIFFGILMVEP